MKIAWLHNWSEVDHVAKIVVTGLLEHYDAVVVNSYLGVEQYRKFIALNLQLNDEMVYHVPSSSAAKRLAPSP